MTARDEFPEMAKVARYSHAVLDRVNLHAETGTALDRLDALRPLIAAARNLAELVLGRDPDFVAEDLAWKVRDLTTPKRDTP